MTAKSTPESKELSDSLGDIEDIGGTGNGSSTSQPTVSTSSKRKRVPSDNNELEKNWREILGPPPPSGETVQEREVWIRYHKRKWAIQMKQREARKVRESRNDGGGGMPSAPAGAGVLRTNLGGFLRRAQQTLLSSMWQILQVCCCT